MFAIYDTNGLYFRDTLEKLRQVQPVAAATGSRLKTDTAESPPERHYVTGKSPDDVVSGKAQQAYKEMLHLNQREPIVHAYQFMSSPVSTISMENSLFICEGNE